MHATLGNALRDMGQFDEAITSFHRAIELEPDDADAHNGLANVLKDQGRPAEAEGAFRRALQCKPEDAAIHSNLVCMLHFQPGLDTKTIGEEQERWNRQFSQ